MSSKRKNQGLISSESEQLEEFMEGLRVFQNMLPENTDSPLKTKWQSIRGLIEAGLSSTRRNYSKDGFLANLDLDTKDPEITNSTKKEAAFVQLFLTIQEIKHELDIKRKSTSDTEKIGIIQQHGRTLLKNLNDLIIYSKLKSQGLFPGNSELGNLAKSFKKKLEKNPIFANLELDKQTSQSNSELQEKQNNSTKWISATPSDKMKNRLEEVKKESLADSAHSKKLPDRPEKKYKQQLDEIKEKENKEPINEQKPKGP